MESLQKANVLKLNEDELPLLISLLSLSTDFVEAIADSLLVFRSSMLYSHKGQYVVAYMMQVGKCHP